VKRFLVTGGAGFIGSNFVRFLLEKDPQAYIVNLDRLTYAGSRENLEDLRGNVRHVFIQGDICDPVLVRKILDAHEIDVIVNFAAETHVDRSIEDPSGFVRTNITGTFNLLECAREYWLGRYEQRRFHQISTDEVYGDLNQDATPCTESAPYRPSSPYAASKASADHLVRAYFRTYGFPATVSVSSNNYGPYQFPEKIIPLAILNALHGKPIPIYGNGHQTRDWVFVNDHCEAVYQILLKGTPGESYNVGGQSQVQNIRLVERICGVLDELQHWDAPHSKWITYVADRPGHDRRYALDISKIEREVGWTPTTDLNTGLRMTMQWYLEKSGWVAKRLADKRYTQWIERNYRNRKRT